MELPPSLVISPPAMALSKPTALGIVVVMVGKQRGDWAITMDKPRICIKPEAISINFIFNVVFISLMD